MGKNKLLTREEYKIKFDELFSKMNYIPQAGEEIVQCKEGYPPYWFISNKCRLFSVYNNKIKILKPKFDSTGKANKEGERAGKTWRYGTKKQGEKNLTRYTLAEIVADHFCEDEWSGYSEYEDEPREIHHITKRANFSPDEGEACNRADNLQRLPKSVHKDVNYYSGKTIEELERETRKKLDESGCPQLYCSKQALMNLLCQLVTNSRADGECPSIIMTSINKDVKKIKAEAHPITGIYDL